MVSEFMNIVTVDPENFSDSQLTFISDTIKLIIDGLTTFLPDFIIEFINGLLKDIAKVIILFSIMIFIIPLIFFIATYYFFKILFKGLFSILRADTTSQIPTTKT